MKTHMYVDNKTANHASCEELHPDDVMKTGRFECVSIHNTLPKYCLPRLLLYSQ